tara:strand:- start:293 stop:1006 length:714 start_codon:yes stop_codon:yes gene_type:complete
MKNKITNKKILTLIMARGGSKGLPKKNIKSLHGKPLIQYTIEAAIKSKFTDEIILSSDCNKIIEIAKNLGIRVPFKRPKRFAQDKTKFADAILHAMNWIERNNEYFDYVLVLVPTTPLRDTEELDKCLDYFFKLKKAKGVFSVSECGHHPLQANILPKNLSMKNFIKDSYKRLNRQELPKYYQLSGSICISEWKHYKREKSFLTDETFAFVTSRKKALDIDTLEDFKLAEILMSEDG